jgi:long-chain fatty acid transport protein
MKANKEEAIMYRRLTQIVLALVLVAAFSAVVFASNGTQIGTVGAKSTAMGSAFRGLADDWSAAYFNPAGITQFGKWEIGGSLGMIMPRGSYQAYPYPSQPFAGLSTAKVNCTDRNFLVPALGVFYKPTEKLSVGLGVYAPFGLGTEWDFYSVPASYGNPNALSKEKEMYSDHMVLDIQPTVAYKLTEKLSLGLGVKYTWGKMTLDEVMLPLTSAILYENTHGTIPMPVINQLLGGIAQVGPLIGQPVDPSRIIVESNLEGDGSAYGFNAGLLFKPFEKLSIGVSGRYSTPLKLKGDFKLTAGMPNLTSHIGALQQGGQIDAATAGLLSATFNGANHTITDIHDVEAELPLPVTVGAGIAFKPCCCWTITADASWTNWEAWDKIELKQNDVAINAIELGWKNTIELGAGVEFLALKTDCKKLFVRLGGYTVDSPVPNKTMNPTLLDPARRYMLTGGLGLAMGKVTVDLAYEHAFFAEKDIPASEYNIGPEGYPGNYAGKYNFSANVFTLGLGLSL